MSEQLRKLLSIASDPILTPPHPSEIIALNCLGPLQGSLFEILSLKNGWYAFESALHSFPLGQKAGVLDLQTWNSELLWRDCYQDLTKGCFFFAEDIFGSQFCFKDGQIHTFDPETGLTQFFSGDITEWADKILSDFNLHTGYRLAHEWQLKHGMLKSGDRLLPKQPFVLQGDYILENLYAGDCVEGMRFRASIALQLRGLADGSRVKLRITK